MDSKMVLAEICAKAPSIEIRNCIRNYNLTPGKEYEALAVPFKKEKIGTLVETLKYLNAPNLRPNLEDYTKSGIIFHTICRLQGLFPEVCTTCNEEYRTKITEQSLLACDNCGQEVHHQCLTKLFEPTAELTSQSIKDFLNPFKLKEWSFICLYCKEKSSNKLKDLKKSVIEAESKANANANIPSTSGITHQTPQTEQLEPNSQVIPDQNAPSIDIPAIPATSSPASEDQPLPPEVEDIPDQNRNQGEEGSINQSSTNTQIPSSHPDSFENLCLEYTKFACKYGRRGIGCPHEHPEMCQNFLDHGLATPHGCDGKKCMELHPKVCSNSLKHLKCFNTHCDYIHIKGQ